MICSLMKNLSVAFVMSCIAFTAQAQSGKPPTIKSFSPEAGPPGQEIRIKGANFGKNSADVEVRLGGVPVQVTAVRPNEIRVKVTPNNRSGVFQLAVSGVRSKPSSSVFEVYPPLKATKMDPMTVAPGGEVRIYGSGFSSDPADHRLFIGRASVAASRIEGNAAVFNVPAKATPGPNTVRLEVKKRGVIHIPIALNIAANLSITNITPTEGAPGSRLTINGQGFGNSPSQVRVMLGGAYAQIHSVTPNAITVSVPAVTVPSTVTVQTKKSGSAVSAQTFSPEVPVVITGFAPTAGQPNQQVRLYGQGFSANPRNNKVTFSGKKAAVTEAAPNTLVVKIPKGVSSDTFKVDVNGGGSAESKGIFQIAEPIAISSFSPDNGGVGAFIRIKGQGFSSKGMRAFVGQKPAGMRVFSETQAMIGIPAGAVDGPIMLISPTGARAVSKKYLKIIPDISVNKFYPLSGRPGTKVTIYGDQFSAGKTSVFLGKTQLKIDPGMNNTMMVVTIPDTADSGPFRVAVQGRREVRSVGAFKVIPPLETYKPASDKPKETSVLEVKPDDKPVIEKLMNETPPPAAAQKEKNGKAPSIDELLGFESDGEKLQISTIDPPEGAAGDTVMINGSGFGDNPDKVTAWVGEKKASVVGCVPDMIMVEVPEGATSGKIKIKIAGKPVLSSKADFTVK